MKNINLKSYLAGIITTVTLLALTVGVFAASTGMTISVNSDIKLKVSGEDFVPKDAAGKPVFVFEYNGTTYVPMRAISEKLGYKIGYNNDTRTAMIGKTNEEVGIKPVIPPTTPTVTLPENANDLTYEQFKGMFESERVDEGLDEETGKTSYQYHFIYKGDLSSEILYSYFDSINIETRKRFIIDWANELKSSSKGDIGHIRLYIKYGLKSFGYCNLRPEGTIVTEFERSNL